MKNDLLHINDLWVHFTGNSREGLSEESNILKGISLAVRKGEILGLMGPSGCGKTLLAMTVMGMAQHMGASVKKGNIVYYMSNSKQIDIAKLNRSDLMKIRGREIALIFQNPASVLNPVMPVGKQLQQTISFYNRLSGTNRTDIKKEVHEVMTLCGLDKYPEVEKRYPHELSTGLCQRVAIALGICGRPKLLIADEPTASLDAEGKAWILRELHKINKTLAMSIVFISHDRQACETISDRILYMKHGIIGG
jgi:ABC-type dipeptide/oligopeptide/nickel transport system ATPase component